MLLFITASQCCTKNSASHVAFSCPRSLFLLFLPIPGLSHSYSSSPVIYVSWALMCLLHCLHWPCLTPLSLSPLTSSYLCADSFPSGPNLSRALFVVSSQTLSLRWCQDRLNSFCIMFTQGDTGRHVFLLFHDITGLNKPLTGGKKIKIPIKWNKIRRACGRAMLFVEFYTSRPLNLDYGFTLFVSRWADFDNLQIVQDTLCIVQKLKYLKLVGNVRLNASGLQQNFDKTHNDICSRKWAALRFRFLFRLAEQK